MEILNKKTFLEILINNMSIKYLDIALNHYKIFQQVYLDTLNIENY